MPPADSIATPTYLNFREVSSSEAASLQGRKALTPMIAGSVCGGIMGIAFIIGFSIYFVKRYKRRKLKRAIEAGIKEPRVKEPKKSEESIIIPPDPAVLFGQRQPGEQLFPDRHKKHKHGRSHSRKASSHHDELQKNITNLPNALDSNTSVANTHAPADTSVTAPLLLGQEGKSQE